MISLVELVIGDEIDVRPAKIVAGQEAEKTNFFLQNLFRAATAGIDTTPHVNRVLGLDEEEGAPGEAEAEAEAEEDPAEAAARA